MANVVTVNWKGNMKFESDNPGGHNFFIDAGEEMGGHGEGMRPKALMLSALAGCSGLDVVSILNKMKVGFEDYNMVITGHLTEEHPKYYHMVEVVYNFYGKDLDKKKIERAVDLSDTKYCGVMEMFKKFAELEISVKYHDK
jgi:putative redox protein